MLLPGPRRVLRRWCLGIWVNEMQEHLRSKASTLRDLRRNLSELCQRRGAASELMVQARGAALAMAPLRSALGRPSY